MLGGIESALLDAGLSTEVEGLKALFQSQFDVISEDFSDLTGRAALLGGASKQTLNAIVDDRLEMAGEMINRYVGEVRSTVLDYVVAGKKLDFKQIIDDVGDGPINHLKTEMNTAVMAFGRVVHLEKAKKAGFDKYLYIGPDDKVTRPFCHEHIGQIYTLEQIQALDNDQGLPVEIYGGGYNCRHQWRPVSDELADELLQAEDAN